MQHAAYMGLLTIRRTGLQVPKRCYSELRDSIWFNAAVHICRRCWWGWVQLGCSAGPAGCPAQPSHVTYVLSRQSQPGMP